MMNVSFDFDGTLHRDGHPLWPAMGLLRWHHQTGHRVMIAFTSHHPKVATLVRHGIELHYDDDPAEQAAATGTGVHVVLLNGVTLHV